MMTLHPGDLISTGSPAGVGTARATPVYFKDGDRSTCTIESIGTLRNVAQAEESGRRLPRDGRRQTAESQGRRQKAKRLKAKG